MWSHLNPLAPVYSGSRGGQAAAAGSAARLLEARAARPLCVGARRQGPLAPPGVRAAQVGPPGVRPSRTWPRNQIDIARLNQDRAHHAPPVLVRPRQPFRFGTLNTLTLQHEGDAELLAAELDAASVKVCGIQEVRRRGAGDIELNSPGCEGWHLLWSGQEQKHVAGVGALLHPTAKAALKGVESISERLMLLHFHGTIPTTVVVAYAPTNSPPATLNAELAAAAKTRKDAEKTAFYRRLSGALDSIPACHLVVVLGDMNARVGRDRVAWDGIIGGWGCPRTKQPPWTAATGPPAQPCPPPHIVNDNGLRCLELCSTHGLMVSNTFFRHRDEHTASHYNNRGWWATPDLILVSRRFRTSVMDTRALPQAVSHHSDHRLVVCDIKLQLKAPRQEHPPRPARFNTDAARNPDVLARYVGLVAAALQARAAACPVPISSQEEADALVAAVLGSAHAAMGLKPRPDGKPWISEATMQLSALKREAYDRWQHSLEQAALHVADPSPMELVHRTAAAAAAADLRQMYKAANRLTRASASKDKHTMLEAQARRMDSLMHANKTHAAFQVLNQLRGKQGSDPPKSVRTAAGLCHGPDVAHAMADHFEATLNVPSTITASTLNTIPTSPADAAPGCPVAAAASPSMGVAPPAPAGMQTRRTTALTGADALAAAATAAAAAATQAQDASVPSPEEVGAAVSALKNTAAGQNGVEAAMIKLADDVGVAWLHRVISVVWDTEAAPEDWQQSLMVALAKAGDPLVTDNYRGITLLDVCGKVYVNVIHGRIRVHLCNQLLPVQHGFRPGHSTGGAISSLRRLMEQHNEYNTSMWTAFVDFRKAFDSINREALWRVLAARGVCPKLIQLIKNLYSGCAASLQLNGATSRMFPMTTGVRQGCPMSPTLFNTYFDFVTRLVAAQCSEAGVQGVKVAFRINGQLVSAPERGDLTMFVLMLLYADDLALTAGSAEALETALRTLEATAGEWGMQLNYGKTVVVRTGARAEEQPPAELQLTGGAVKVDTQFRYLGSLMVQSGDVEQELNRRLSLAGMVVSSLRTRVLLDRDVSLNTKLRIYKAVVLPTLLYGAAESWALTEKQLRRLDVFHNNCLRTTLGVRLRGASSMSNAQLYAETGSVQLRLLLRVYRLRWLGHIGRMRDDNPLKQMLFSTRAVAAEGTGRDEGRRRVGRQKPTWARMALQDVHAVEHSAESQARVARGALPTTSVANWQVDCLDKKKWFKICQSAAPWVNPREAV
jgi:hypothetical protein